MSGVSGRRRWAPRRILLLAVVLAGIALCGCVAVAAVGQSGSPSARGEPARPADGPPAPERALDRDPWVAGFRAAEEARFRRAAEVRQSPEARQGRELSRQAFADLPAANALEVHRDRLPELLRSRWEQPRELTTGRVERYLGDHEAVVSSESGETLLLDSVLPLRVTGAGGRKVPLDMGLEPSPEYYAPRSPLAPLRIHRDLRRGVEFPDVGVSMRHVGASGSVDPTVVGGQVFWANVDVDTDLLASPLPSGLETFVLLRSWHSPEQHRLEFDLPADARLEEATNPGDGIRVVRGDKDALRIPPPVAWDADGQPVEVAVTAEKNALLLAVPHRSRDVSYPVVVDPLIYESYEQWNTNPSLDFDGWDVDASSGNFFFGRDSSGLYIFNTWAQLEAGDFGEWFWKAPGDVKVAEASFIDVTHTPSPGGISCIYEGVWSASLSAESGTWTTWPYSGISGSSPWATCDPQSAGHWKIHSIASPTAGNQARFIYWMWNTAWRQAGNAILGGARLGLTDASPPTVTATAQPRWIHPTATDSKIVVATQASDAGLGVGSFTLTANGQPQTRTVSCNGTRHAPCPLSAEPDPDFEIETSGLADGLYHATARATDIVNQSSAQQPFDFGVDRQPPTVPQLSGALYDLRGQTLPHGQYQLNFSAQDGNAAGPDTARQSGVTKLDVYLGKPGKPASFDRVFQKKQDCATDSCTLSGTWTLNTLEEAGGSTSVKVVATDGVNHKSTSAAFDVTLPESGELITPKDAARTTKYLQLQAKANASEYTSVKFQFRRPTAGVWGSWADIPTSSLTKHGSPVGDVQQPLDPDPQSRRSPLLVWDVPAAVSYTYLVGIGGPELVPVPLQVRAVFAGGQGGSSRAHDVTLDQEAPAVNATEPIGPGRVDLSTGNFSYSATDVQIAGFGQALTVTRTYNSRVTSSMPLGPFGVSTWTLGVDVAGASSYAGLRESTDGNGDVEVVLTDGSKIWFEARPTSFLPEPGFEDLTLYPKEPAPAGSGCLGNVYRLADVDGNETSFERQGGEWVVCKVRQAGQSDQATTSRFAYESGPDGKPRVKKVAAPAPTGSSCLSSITAGCRVLEFIYGSSGPESGRLTAVKFHSIETVTGGETVVQYEYTSDGKLAAAFDSRISPALRETYTYTPVYGHRLETINPPGEAGWKLIYQPLSSWDFSNGRLSAVERPAGGAKTSVFYRLPVTGVSARYELGANAVATWGQTEPPTDATAIVPATEPSPSASSPKATVYYLDPAGRLVNTVLPRASNTQTNFEATTAEYDEHDNVIRELSAANRRKALAMGGDTATTAARARLYDTQRTYSPDGLELQLELGPLHEVQLPSGTVAQARARTATSYGCNEQEPKAHLPTRTETGAQLTDLSIVDVRVSTIEYECALRQPKRTVTDPDGLGLTHAIKYDLGTGLPTETRMPSNPDVNTAGDASTTRTMYYTDGPHPVDSACGNHAEWWNLPCKTRPAAQPNTPGLPNLPETTYTYNRFQQVTAATERVGTITRTTATTYDSAGRKTGESVSTTGGTRGLVGGYGLEEGSGSSVADGSGSGNNGTITGASWTTSGHDGKALSFDGVDDRVRVPHAASLAQAGAVTLESWVNPSAFPGSGLPATLIRKDDQYQLLINSVGAVKFRIWKNPGGQQELASPNGVVPVGQWHHVAATWDGATFKIYVDGVERASAALTGTPETSTDALYLGASYGSADWFNGRLDEVRVYNRALTPAEIQADRDTPLAAGTGDDTDNWSYSYDNAGRLTQVTDRPANLGCTTRSYGFNANSNRLTRTTRLPAAGGACDTSSAGQVQSSAYDAADRLTSSGVAYDPFGRMTTVPASHSGGGALTTSYYANDMVREQTQDGVTKSWLLDPTGSRYRATIPNGPAQEILHYADDSDSPAWTAQMDGTTEQYWTRNVEGIDSDLAAIYDSRSGAELQLTNLHGDIIATTSTSPSATGPLATIAADEFGNPKQTSGRRYGWLGGKQRRTALPSGVVQMGVRSYVPEMGRFASVDPVPTGSANAYDYANADPINQLDLDGRQVRVDLGNCSVRAQLPLKVANRFRRGRYQVAAEATFRCHWEPNEQPVPGQWFEFKVCAQAYDKNGWRSRRCAPAVAPPTQNPRNFRVVAGCRQGRDWRTWVSMTYKFRGRTISRSIAIGNPNYINCEDRPR
jgi:RHS repeat-associated protein